MLMMRVPSGSLLQVLMILPPKFSSYCKNKNILKEICNKRESRKYYSYLHLQCQTIGYSSLLIVPGDSGRVVIMRIPVPCRDIRNVIVLAKVLLFILHRKVTIWLIGLIWAVIRRKAGNFYRGWYRHPGTGNGIFKYKFLYLRYEKVFVFRAVCFFCGLCTQE